MTTMLTVFDVAAQLQVAPKTVRKLAQKGTLRASRIARQWRFEPAAVAQFKAAASYRPEPPPEAPVRKTRTRPLNLRGVRRRFV